MPENADVTCTDLSEVTSLNVGAGATVRFNTDTAPNFPITGSGTIVKAGTATWTMTTSIPDFNGDYEIAAGVVNSGIATAFGSNNSSYKVTVKNGATLVFTSLDGALWSRNLHIAGDGAEGRNGAVEYPAASDSAGRWPRLILDADATIYVPKGFTIFIDTTLNLDGHRLTVAGGGEPTIMAHCKVSTTGEIYIKGEPSARTSVILRSWAHDDPAYQITPSSDAPFVLPGNAIVYISAGVKPVDRPIWVSGVNNQLKHASNANSTHGWVTNHANWVGPITFTNQTGISEMDLYNGIQANPLGACMLCVSGPISGPGRVKTSRWYGVGRVAILNPANSYTGGTYFDGNKKADATTLLGYPGSIPNRDYASVTSSYGYADLAVADDYSRWDLDSALRFAQKARWNDSSRPRFSSEFTTNGIGPIRFQVSEGISFTNYLGALDAVRFEGTGNEDPIGFWWYGGTAYLAGPQPILLDNARLRFPDVSTATNSSVRIVDGADVTVGSEKTLYIGYTDSKQSRLVVSNAVLKGSKLDSSNFGSNDAVNNVKDALFVGFQSPGILEVFDGAVISNRLIISPYNSSGVWNGSGQGAVYQRGGHVVAMGASQPILTSSIGQFQGNSSCGYYELLDGVFESRGKFLVGGYGHGCFAQYGGRVIITNAVDAAAGAKNSNLAFASLNQGRGFLYVKKGSWDVFSSSIYFTQGSTPEPRMDFTLDGPEASFDAHDTPFYTAYRQSCGRYNYNLNGGVLRCGGIRNYSMEYAYNKKIDGETVLVIEPLTNNVLCVNFNGGTFKAGADGKNLFGYEATTNELWATNVAVYAGGATIDTDGRTGNRLDTPVRGAWGKGVKSITLSAPISGTGYITSPRVTIDGDGLGASAFAHFDSTNMVVDRIIVTSPGCGYTTATATLFYGNNEYTAATCEVELEDNENTGSFTKAGEGDLTLNATNTWGGATIVAGGTLKAGCDWAVPENSAVVIGGGGVLDLNGKVARIASIEYKAGGGSIVNASAAELPASFSMRTTVGDIIAGRAIAFTGDQDLSGKTLTIEGSDYSALDKGARRYRVLTVSGGELTKPPTIAAEELPPAPWAYTVRKDGVVLSYVAGALFTIR